MHPAISAPIVALSLAAAAAMATASLAGLAVPGLYRDDAFFTSAWFWNDWINLIAAALLAGAVRLAARGSLRGILVLFGMLHFAVHDYAFYLFGAALNPIWPLYPSIVALAAMALIGGAMRLNTGGVAARFRRRTPVHAIGGYMIASATVLAAVWIGQWAAFMATGTAPQIGGSEPAFRLVAGLDLTLIVPGVAVGGVWLWQRKAWGYVLAVLFNVSGALSALVLFAGTLAQAHSGIADAAILLPLWGFFALASALAAAVLLRNVLPKAPLDLSVKVRAAARI